MLAALIITLRETLEASLIVGIVLAYLKKTENSRHGKFVWGGVAAGLVLSVVLAFVFEAYFGGFTGKAEELYEGVAMMLAAGLLTWMIMWMLVQRAGMKAKIEDKVHAHIEGDRPWALFFLTFIAVAREGIETVLFLQAAAIAGGTEGMLTGGLMGIVVAIGASYLLFKGIAKFPLRKFFTVSSVLLIMFAAGLVAHGLHEFQEAGVVPVLAEHVWDINPAVVEEGIYPLMHEKGAIGGLFKGVFGYNGNPNLLEVLSYVAYLALISGAWMWVGRREKLRG
jgi:high-affinity iron transporter